MFSMEPFGICLCCPGIIYLPWKYYTQTIRKHGQWTNIYFWMLFTTELRMREILGSNFQTDQVPFWSVKCCYVQFFCHSFLLKGGIYLETQPLSGTQQEWTDHQVPLTPAPNQLGSRYSKWDVAGRPLRGSSHPRLLEEESQGQGRGPESLLWLLSSRINERQYIFWLQKAAWAISAPSGTR